MSKKYYAFLHLLIALYSVTGILSKFAAKEATLSWKFILLYLGIIAILGIYAIGWQQILKHLPLSVAYANKAASIIWGCVWGLLIFNEGMTVGKVMGAAFVLIGVALFGYADGRKSKR